MLGPFYSRLWRLKPSNIIRTFYILQPMVTERMRFSIPARNFYFGFFTLVARRV